MILAMRSPSITCSSIFWLSRSCRSHVGPTTRATSNWRDESYCTFPEFSGHSSHSSSFVVRSHCYSFSLPAVRVWQFPPASCIVTELSDAPVLNALTALRCFFPHGRRTAGIAPLECVRAERCGSAWSSANCSITRTKERISQSALRNATIGR